MKKKEVRNKSKTKTIKVDYLARVEGEGALYIKVKDDKIKDVKLKIFEPPRFFEALLRGRRFDEAPDITARICGICPVAYQMSACHAMEDAFGINVDGQLRALRRLIYCGEWIASHTLHVYMLHAPDFLGYESAIEMAKDHPKQVERGLKLKKAGNEIMSLIGGREIHPINVCVGGFYKLPTKKDLDSLVDGLKWARDAAMQTIDWVSKFPFPDFYRDYEFVALKLPDEYPFNEGRLVSNKGLDIDVSEYDNNFSEEHISHTNALHSVINGRGEYFVGPMARYNLNFDKLTPLAKEAAKNAGLDTVCNNTFKSIIIRSIEILYACDEALRIIDEYEIPEKARVNVEPTGSTGYGCTEAPRGILYHSYSIDNDGVIADAKIVPPTSQNQKTIESDLYDFVNNNIRLSDKELTWQCEQTIRNYDPCISCATHFLKVDIERE
ncbi:MAG: Ni/Fe hydrogenase subunit alpha [Candidatus Dadabacteria bacterium]|nr:Ni/Fe hydrogenase subunit alpha [Candidatus Dadabacteria bacterium]NIS08456.1 Ni/Fe hydrogenase subunit alpha [Candidatus Dadabacteria bacterium]NIY21944.1 Ni/Fe hydrogenase subunit alpha [Candidatus Dadabacteria bacterium]